MLGATLIISAFIAGAFASGEFSVFVSPDSIAFKGDEKLNSAYLGDVYAASLGRSVSGNAHWSGLHIIDPFSLPENGFVFVVDGIDHLKFDSKVKTYRLYGSDAEDSLSTLSSKLNVADIDLSEGVDRAEQFGDIGAVETKDIPKETSNLNPQLHSEDRLFIDQIAYLNSLSRNVATDRNLPSLAIIRLSLAPIRSAHGDNSLALQEAKQLLADTLENFAKNFPARESNTLVTVVTNESNQLLRSKRETTEATLTAKDINVAAYYSEDYPVIFNIILWFMVVLVFSLLAISYAIATMDPGRDSIIYRMTSTRMKKDN